MIYKKFISSAISAAMILGATAMPASAATIGAPDLNISENKG